jgi:uncharacterized protein (TIGR02145 family)
MCNKLSNTKQNQKRMRIHPIFKTSFTIFAFIFLGLYACKKENPVNLAPEKPVLVAPADQSVLTRLPVELIWTCMDADSDSLLYDLYFGETDPPALLASGLTAPRYPDCAVESEKTYYWKIIAKDQHDNVTQGDIWSFSVGNLPPGTPVNPLPEHASTDQNPTVLSWECTEPEGETLTFNIYFGTDNTPELIAENHTETSYTLPQLAGGTLYYWKVVAKDSYGNQIPGPLWMFTTGLFPPELIFPEDYSDNAPWFPKFKWSGNYAGDLTYDLYIGTSSNPELYAGDITSESYHHLEQLIKGQTYYWKVVSKNEIGDTAESPIQQFTVFGDPIPGSFTDARDGTVYQTITIGRQTWMAENLKIFVPGSKIYDDNPDNEDIYGRLYTWEQAMNGEEASNENPSGVQGIAPEGWHIPSDQEWLELIYFIGGHYDSYNFYMHDAAEKLKEVGTEHWNSSNGTNESGFNALPAGRFEEYYGYGYTGLGDETDIISTSSLLDLMIYNDLVYIWGYGTYASVRCIKNNTIEKNN